MASKTRNRAREASHGGGEDRGRTETPTAGD